MSGSKSKKRVIHRKKKKVVRARTGSKSNKKVMHKKTMHKRMPSKYNEFIARKTRGGNMTLSEAAHEWSARRRIYR